MWIDIFLLIFTILLTLASIVFAYAGYHIIRHKVPSIPSGHKTTNTMIRHAKIQPGDKVYDLGCGFGGLLFQAYKIQPKAIYTGFEVVEPILWWARIKARLSNTKIKFKVGDFFTQDLSRADIVFCYLWPSIMERVEREIWPTLKPGAVIISNAFPLPNVSAERHDGRVYAYRKD